MLSKITPTDCFCYLIRANEVSYRLLAFIKVLLIRDCNSIYKDVFS